MDIQLRPAEPGDLEALFEMNVAHTTERGTPVTFTRDDIDRDWFDKGRFEASTMSRVAVVDGKVVAHVSYEAWFEQVHSEGYVMPSHRGLGLGTQLLRWLVATARSLSGITSVWTWAPGERAEALTLLENEGFTHDRSFLTLVHTDPGAIAAPEWPANVEIRKFDNDEASRRAAEGWNLSFIDHWNFHPDTAEDYAERLRNPEEDTALWAFAFEGDTLAGFCLTSVRKTDKQTIGNLGPIGTSRSHRGIGLGRALLRNAVRMLAERGADEVRLGVDSENLSGAVRLYESNGFERTNEGRAYRFDL